MAAGAYAARRSFDFGGVLTTSVWDSFAAFCRGRGARPGRGQEPLPRATRRRWPTLRGLETGELSPRTSSSSRFGARLGPRRPRGPDRQHVRRHGARRADGRRGARAARAAGVHTGLISNSWSTGHYDRELLDRALRRGGDLRRGRPAQAPARDLPARRRAARGRARAGCVFVDDLRENCEGAEAVGMTADPPPRAPARRSPELDAS